MAWEWEGSLAQRKWTMDMIGIMETITEVSTYVSLRTHLTEDLIYNWTFHAILSHDSAHHHPAGKWYSLEIQTCIFSTNQTPWQ